MFWWLFPNMCIIISKIHIFLKNFLDLNVFLVFHQHFLFCCHLPKGHSFYWHAVFYTITSNCSPLRQLESGANKKRNLKIVIHPRNQDIWTQIYNPLTFLLIQTIWADCFGQHWSRSEHFAENCLYGFTCPYQWFHSNWGIRRLFWWLHSSWKRSWLFTREMSHTTKCILKITLCFKSTDRKKTYCSFFFFYALQFFSNCVLTYKNT